uniref:Integrase catalytic domain-containing protein n=1 Tax=Meloidogyne enterolobii TaxID=390850 RepID=A0A6V7X826_MELEN|nr:unnamed protein product [Meloidogyne enterolobii]
MADYTKLLNNLYNNPNSPAAYSGIDSLWHEAKKVYKHIPRYVIEHFLEGHRTYSLMRPRRVNFKRARTIASGFMTDVQVDLADMQSLAQHNKGNRYILLGIDVLSKRLFATPLKTKGAKDVIEAFKKLFEQMPMIPYRIFSDKGKEFKNKLIDEYFEQEDIHKLEATHSIVKASLAERAIRNLKQRLYRYFSQNKSLNWIDVLVQIIDGINHSICRVHGMRPIDINFENAQKVWKKIYGNALSTKSVNKNYKKFKEGDYVRKSFEKGQFEKGYIPNWGDEIVQVDKIIGHSKPIIYKLKNNLGNRIKGSFYKEQLARVRKDAETEYRIEKIYRKRTRDDGTKEVLVKFIGYPIREWIPETELV